ncbi:NitT/TauT family transport system permease protein [Azospirillum baldaniorum]|uniref:ABC transporter permease n=1 Tax=Azospirillum baldaniorum TaxID=1064539 RepID=UPI0011ADCDF2|nr:ABC transporter permease [Azospirillum baldaniorum]TWA57386.1 NitT/TauT family transport system permease protein [Azospirillum baldaniorum]
MSVTLTRLTLLAAVGMVWWGGAQWLPSYVLPGPERVFDALRRLAAGGDLTRHLAITLARVAAGFALAVAVGVPFGLLLGYSRRMATLFEPVLPILNTVSAAIWSIFAVIWFGLSDAATVFVVLMTALPLIVTNVWQGTRDVNADLVEAARAFGYRGARLLALVYMPQILPHLFSGARLAFGFGWRVSLVAETLGASSGVGYRMRQASDLIQIDQVFAWTLVVITLMATLELAVLRPAENRLFAWRKAVG